MSQAQKIFGTACKSLPKIAAPKPPRKQLSCGGDRTSPVEEARSDWQEVAVTDGVSHGTFPFSGPSAIPGKSSWEKLGILWPFAFSDCSPRRSSYELCGPSLKEGFTPLLGQTSI